MEQQEDKQHPRWRQAIEDARLGVWDLRPELEAVQHSPQWKARLGFPDPHEADSTHFWRCRVHPDDLDAMLDAMRTHARGDAPHYEARFRLRSNGSGYRLLHSRGRVVERDGLGRALRIVGTMIDLTERAPSPRGGLAVGARELMAVRPLAWPFHRLLADRASLALAGERARLLPLVEDLLEAAMLDLQQLPQPPGLAAASDKPPSTDR
ncbi:PAS domain-containing protein [Pelomonas sp. KK5]|uniref:PAS domain-containing protein n=1 Tax=Pelomonas sp. KK5 TaxID=1855730 RepID=UPI00097BD4C0|nr:PAS domain-containing protein [Pelomonas sp. KK5]